jgi:magnesium chelatase subunit D
MRYPFSALVGQDQLKLALLLNAVDPEIGGVLISGEKGTAKSTAARALVDLLPAIRVREGCPVNSAPDQPIPNWLGSEAEPDRATWREIERPVPFVELPLGATEDRVVGTLDFERALREGRRAFQPGLLAAANRGILYTDEVNLLADHLVDVLLDVAASGINVVQREGIEVIHPARFFLIGTMNAEEGPLRPQLLDRFGLSVELIGPRDPELRMEVVRRRVAFDADPVGFAQAWSSDQHAVRARIRDARQQLAAVVVDDAMLRIMSQICCEAFVQGMRADVTLYKTARALAAWEGRSRVAADDVHRSSDLVLHHRRRPGDSRRSRPENLGPKPSAQARDHPEPTNRPRSSDARSEPKSTRAERDQAESDNRTEPGTPSIRDAATTIFRAAETGPVTPMRIEAAEAEAKRRPGRRNRSAQNERGRYVRAVADPDPPELAVDATLRSAAARGLDPEGRLAVERSDWHRKQREGRADSLILLVVDASGSMAARRRMEAVKGAVLGLLADAVQQRDRVGVIGFRGARAELLLAPSARIEPAEHALHALPTGGRTPLAHALVLTADTVVRARRADPKLLSLVVLLTDGRANVPLPDTDEDPWIQSLNAARQLALLDVPALVLDTDSGFIRLGRAQELARALGSEYLPLDELTAESLTLVIQEHRRSAGQALEIGILDR